jgi:hypothetical protein
MRSPMDSASKLNKEQKRGGDYGRIKSFVYDTSRESDQRSWAYLDQSSSTAAVGKYVQSAEHLIPGRPPRTKSQQREQLGIA